ncbi:MAG: hypothetical protein K5669_05150 [Lachnospiraceae bacterium]|nr:hypothetical protein [Lachnospiraceae bacterium]
MSVEVLGFDEFNTEYLDEIDKSFLNHLQKDTELICSKTEKADSLRSFFDITKGCFIHLYGEHLKLVRNDFENLYEAPFEFELLEERYSGEIPFLISERCKDIYKGLPVLPFSFVNEAMYAEISEIDLILHNRELLKLFFKYKRLFGKIYESKADEFFVSKAEELFIGCPKAFESFKKYFNDIFSRFYIRSVRDYYVIEPLLAAGFQTLVLLLFAITYKESKKEMNIEAFEGLIKNVDKLFENSAAMRERNMDRIRQKLF